MRLDDAVRRHDCRTARPVPNNVGGWTVCASKFQKKSKGGIKTPKTEIELIKSRLKRAEDEPAEWLDARNK